MKIKKIYYNIFYQSVFFLALIATFGSLYFSEIAGYPPCVLCWYQRITMYPLVVILGVGYLFKDKMAIIYSLILTSIGSFIASYHVLLYYKLIPESIKPCKAGISCTTKYIEWFGFVTIPLLSLIAHFLILILLVYLVKSKFSADND